MQVENVSVLPIGIVSSLFNLISGILDKIVIIIIETPFKTRNGKWCILAFAQLYPLFWAKQSFLFFLFCLNLWVMVCAVTLFNFILSMFCCLFMSNRRKQLSYLCSMELIWTVEHLMVNLH